MRRLGITHAILHPLDGIFDMPIGDVHVGPAIQIVIKEKAAEAKREQTGAAIPLGAASSTNSPFFSL